MNAKKLIAAVLIMALVMSLPAAGIFAEADGVDTVTIAYNKDIDSFSPIVSVTEQASTTVIFEPMWKTVLETGEKVLCIAKSFEWTDPLTLHIELNEDVYDTAGNHITGSDVVFSIAKTIDLGNNTTFIDIENAKYTDTSVDLPALAPVHAEIEKTLSDKYIFSEAAWNASEDEMALTPVGSGPYKLTEYVANSHCVLSFNEDWHGKTVEPQIKTVKLRFVTDPAQRLNVLRTGEVDYAYGLNFTDMKIIEQSEGIESIVFPSENQLGIYFNMSSPLFKDNLALRQAICYAINNMAVSMVNTSGLAPLAKAIGVQSGEDYTDAFIAGLEELVSDTNYYEYNLEKAKELMKESGVPQGTSIRFLYFTTAGMDTLAKVLQGSLQEIGLNLELDFQSSGASYQAKLFDPNGYDITPLSLQSDPITTWLMFSNNYNLNKFTPEEQAALSEKINQAYVAEGEAKTALLLELEEFFYKNCYAYQIYDSIYLSGKKTNLTPWMYNALYPEYTKWVIE